jgi:hypothetical protein
MCVHVSPVIFCYGRNNLFKFPFSQRVEDAEKKIGVKNKFAEVLKKLRKVEFHNLKYT